MSIRCFAFSVVNKHTGKKLFSVQQVAKTLRSADAKIRNEVWDIGKKYVNNPKVELDYYCICAEYV